MTHLELIHSNKLDKYNRDNYPKDMQRRTFKELGKDVCYCLICSFNEVVSHGEEVNCYCE